MSRYFDFLSNIGERHDHGVCRNGVDAAALYYVVEAHLNNGAVFAGPRLELDPVGLKRSALQQDGEAHTWRGGSQGQRGSRELPRGLVRI